jgi:phage nucleotide-binding protein
VHHIHCDHGDEQLEGMVEEVKHSALGYSAVSTFEQCPFKYKCQYIDGLCTLPSMDPANPLIIGTALHRGIETDVETAIREYFNHFPIITDQHIDEEIKLRHLIPKVMKILPEGIHEWRVIDTNFIGTLDLLVPVSKALHPELGDEEWFDLYDFKYINPKNQDRYLESRQLHLYKYYLEKRMGMKIRNMAFIFIPKVQIRQKKTEDLFQFRKRLMEELEQVQIITSFIDYDPQKVIDHLELTQGILTCEEFHKNPTRLCDWCDYKNFCEKGDLNDMALPSTNRVPVNFSQHKKIWIYGAPFSGKTTVVDAAPTPLNLNTDGNVKTVTMARLPIKDTMEGRQKKLAWEVFKGALDDLEAGSDFETIAVDLLEDMYESCRLYMYKQMGITHESDDSFRAWDKVRTEFLSTIRRLMNLPYNIILISHEDMSKDITKRSGDKITAIKPNIQDKIANKIAGMVDIVCRVLVEDDGRYLSFKSDAVVFGGGRLTGHGKTQIPLTWDAIEEFYADVNRQCEPPKPPVESTQPEQVEEPIQKPVDTPPAEVIPADPQPTRRTRRTRG